MTFPPQGGGAPWRRFATGVGTPGNSTSEPGEALVRAQFPGRGASRRVTIAGSRHQHRGHRPGWHRPGGRSSLHPRVPRRARCALSGSPRESRRGRQSLAAGRGAPDHRRAADAVPPALRRGRSRNCSRSRSQTVGTVPPSMTYSVPVMEPARGETRNATRSATSSGRAGRPMGIPPSDAINARRAPS